MSEKYRRVMDQIYVDGEMRDRVLRNVLAADLTPVPRHNSGRRAAAAAACVALLAVGGLTLPRLQQPLPPEPERPPVTAVKPPVAVRPPVMAGDPFTETASLEELSQAVGFPVPALTGLPFVPEETHYRMTEDGLAEVVASAGEQRAVLRKWNGPEDRSGDFHDYPETGTLQLTEGTALLRGAEGSFPLALWKSGEQSCSLSVTGGLTAEDWSLLLENLK